MNVLDNFPGHGMVRDFPAKPAEQVSEHPDFSQENGSWREPDLTADIAEDLARELQAQTAILSGRAALEKAITDDRGEEARILAIIAQHSAKHRQIKASRRAKEDMRDSLLASEA